MENIVRTIRAYYPVSDEALAALTHGFEKQVFPAKTLIIRAGQFDRNKAGFEYVETLEETLVYSISIETLNELYKSDIDITNWMRVLQQENFLRLQDIHISRLNLSAYERYEKLMSECPALFHRVTLGHIASFLGITQQSLSRIRAKGYFLT